MIATRLALQREMFCICPAMFTAVVKHRGSRPISTCSSRNLSAPATDSFVHCMMTNQNLSCEMWQWLIQAKVKCWVIILRKYDRHFVRHTPSSTRSHYSWTTISTWVSKRAKSILQTFGKTVQTRSLYKSENVWLTEKLFINCTSFLSPNKL